MSEKTKKEKKKKKRGRLYYFFVTVIFAVFVKEVLIPLALVIAVSHFSSGELNGKISPTWVRINFNGSITVYQLNITPKTGDFSLFLRCPRIDVDLNWLALLRGEARVRHLHVYDPVFIFETNDEGEWNFLSIFSRNPFKPALSESSGGGKYFDYPFQNTHLHNASVIIRLPPGKGYHDLKVQDLNGTAVKRGGKVEFTDNILRGTFSGSRVVVKNFQLRFRRLVDFASQVEIKGSDLGALTKDTLFEKERLSGRVNAYISMESNEKTQHRLIGSGFLDVEEGNLWRLPVFLSILNVLDLAFPGNSSFEEARIMFKIHRKSIEFDDMAFLSNSISLIGTGAMKPDGSDMHFYFVHRLGKSDFSILPIFGGTIQGVFDFIKGNLMQIEVVGTFKEPRTKIIPLKPFTKSIGAVKDIFSPGKR